MYDLFISNEELQRLLLTIGPMSRGNDRLYRHCYGTIVLKFIAKYKLFPLRFNVETPKEEPKVKKKIKRKKK